MRNKLLLFILAFPILVVLVWYFGFVQRYVKLTGTNCGSILEGYLRKEKTSDEDKEKAIQCLKQNFDSCTQAYLTVSSLGPEGKTFDRQFQIKNSDTECVIERYNYGLKVNTCKGVELSTYQGKEQLVYHASMVQCNKDQFTDILKSYKYEKSV